MFLGSSRRREYLCQNLNAKQTKLCVYGCLCVCSHPLAISHVDLPKGGVKLWGWLTFVVLIEEDRRTADLHTELLCALSNTEKGRVVMG